MERNTEKLNSLESLWNASKRHKNTGYTHNKKRYVDFIIFLLILNCFVRSLYSLSCNAMSCWRFPKELALPCGETWPPKVRGVVLLWAVENLSALKGICMERIKKLSRKLRKTPQLPPPETQLEIGQMPEGGGGLLPCKGLKGTCGQPRYVFRNFCL